MQLRPVEPPGGAPMLQFDAATAEALDEP